VSGGFAIDVDIRTLVPHGGVMCLLERVVSASEREVVCATRSHLAPDNPLRHQGQLAALHLAEYGAQATAVHGGLIARASEAPAPAPTRGGMLAAIRDLTLEVARLDDVGGEITITATKLFGNGDGQIYSFAARAEARVLATGRVSVMFGRGAAAPA
jgi:predicted hotdog family 3-hydroxylacyl-ACP dehydratase